VGRWIGIDYGTRRIGLAVGDYRGVLASPAATLSGSGSPARDAEAVLRWAAEQEACGFVAGLPLNMDGSDSNQTRITRRFAEELARQTPLPVELWDERLSSFQADLHLAEAEVRQSRKKGLRDALAAQVILQSFLDRPQADAATTPNPPADPPKG
jgi:putative Holliday junction resolvase